MCPNVQWQPWRVHTSIGNASVSYVVALYRVKRCAQTSRRERDRGESIFFFRRKVSDIIIVARCPYSRVQRRGPPGPPRKVYVVCARATDRTRNKNDGRPELKMQYSWHPELGPRGRPATHLEFLSRAACQLSCTYIRILYILFYSIIYCSPAAPFACRT